jgi:hypothetical protein
MEDMAPGSKHALELVKENVPTDYASHLRPKKKARHLCSLGTGGEFHVLTFMSPRRALSSHSIPETFICPTSHVSPPSPEVIHVLSYNALADRVDEFEFVIQVRGGFGSINPGVLSLIPLPPLPLPFRAWLVPSIQ